MSRPGLERSPMPVAANGPLGFVFLLPERSGPPPTTLELHLKKAGYETHHIPLTEGLEVIVRGQVMETMSDLKQGRRGITHIIGLGEGGVIAAGIDTQGRQVTFNSPRRERPFRGELSVFTLAEDDVSLAESSPFYQPGIKNVPILGIDQKTAIENPRVHEVLLDVLTNPQYEYVHRSPTRTTPLPAAWWTDGEPEEQGKIHPSFPRLHL